MHTIQMKMETRAKKRTCLSIKGAGSSGSRRSILKGGKESPHVPHSSKTESPRSRSTGSLISDTEASPESTAASRAGKANPGGIAGPSCLAESTPKRASDRSARDTSPSFLSHATTPQDKPVFLEDEFSPIELFPCSQSVPLVHWDWNPNRTPLRSSLRKSRRLNDANASSPVAPKRRSSSPDQGPPPKRPTPPTEAPGMSLLEIELRAVNAIISQLETGGKDKQAYVEENFLRLTETNLGVTDLKPEDPSASPAASCAGVGLCGPRDYHTAVTAVQPSNHTQASTTMNSVTSKLENVEEKCTPSTSKAQIVNKNPLKATAKSSKLTLSNPDQVPVVRAAETKPVNTYCGPTQQEKELMSPLRSAFYQDDSLTDCLIACSMQAEEECRKSQELAKKTQTVAASSGSKIIHKPSVSAALQQQNSAPLSSIAVSRTVVATSISISKTNMTRSNAASSSCTVVSSLPPTCSIPSAGSKAPARNTFAAPSVPSLKTVTSAMLPPRRSPRSLSVAKKQSPHKRSMSPPRKIPVVAPPSFADADFNPSWMESIKIATSPLNCSLTNKSMSQSVSQSVNDSKKVFSQNENKMKNSHDNNKNISRTLFSSKASPPNSKQKNATLSSTVTKSILNTRQSSPQCSQAVTTPPCKRNASLNKSIDPFEDSFAFEEYEKIEAQLLSQVELASQPVAPSKDKSTANEVSNSLKICPVSVSNNASNQTAASSKANSYSNAVKSTNNIASSSAGQSKNVKSSVNVVKDSASNINNKVMAGFHDSFAPNAGTKNTVVLSKPASSVLTINKKSSGQNTFTLKNNTNSVQKNSIESTEKFVNQPKVLPAKSTMPSQQTKSAAIASNLASDVTGPKVAVSRQQGANSFPSTLSKPQPKTNSFPQWPPPSTSASKPSQLQVSNGTKAVHSTEQKEPTSHVSSSKVVESSSVALPQKSVEILTKNALSKPYPNNAQQSSTGQKSVDTHTKPFPQTSTMSNSHQQNNSSTTVQKPVSSDKLFWQSRGVFPKHKSALNLPRNNANINTAKQNPSQPTNSSSMQQKSVDNLTTNSTLLGCTKNNEVQDLKQTSSHSSNIPQYDNKQRLSINDDKTNGKTLWQSSGSNIKLSSHQQNVTSESSVKTNPAALTEGVQNGHPKPVPQASSSSVVPKLAPHLSGSPLMRHKSADFAPTAGGRSSVGDPLNQLRLNTSPLVRHRSAGDFGAMQANSQRYSAEEIERKRQEAKLRLQQRRMQAGPPR